MTTRRIRINYTGMDTIEPECEFDGITDIWADLTVYDDPDYVPEEDLDDEDEDYEQDYKPLTKTTTTTKVRPTRNVPHIDYTGMDTIEPECDFDGITDIWADLTIYEDPDYVPEF